MTRKKTNCQKGKVGFPNKIPTYKNINEIIDFINENTLGGLGGYMLGKPKEHFRGLPNSVFMNVQYLKNQFKKYYKHFYKGDFTNGTIIPKGITLYSDWLESMGDDFPKGEKNNYTNMNLVITDPTKWGLPKHNLFINSLTEYIKDRFGEDNFESLGVGRNLSSYLNNITSGEGQVTDKLYRGSYSFYRLSWSLCLRVKNKFSLYFQPVGENGIELYKISVSDKGKGLGTELVKTIMSLSDFSGLDLHLVPSPFKPEGGSYTNNGMLKMKNRLSKWYKSLGLQKLDGLNVFFQPSNHEPKFEKTKEGVILKGNKPKKRKRELELV